MMAEAVNILIVDDEPDLCWALTNTLRKEGYRTTAVTTALEALVKVRQEEFAAVIIDAKLPDMDGMDLVTQIRQVHSKTSIILISGYFYPEDMAVEEGLQQGLFAAFVSKPFNIKEVRSVVRKVIG